MRLDFHILLIDDSPTDAKIVARALREAQVGHRLTVLNDGRKALDYLNSLDAPDCPPEREPDLILLDLNLPGLDGFALLERIKADASLRALPVVVLTTSRRDEDVLQTYQAGANTYLQKPAEYASYRDLMRLLRQYWHETALRPRRPRPPAPPAAG